MDFPSLRTAGDGLTGIKNKVVNAARGLRMPGVGTPDPVPVAPATAAAPLPTIEPAMAPQAAAPSLRAPSVSAPPAIPTLTDVIKPGTGPFVKPPEIPVLTDVLHSAPANNPIANPNVSPGVASAERTAFDAARAAAPAAAPVAEDASLLARGMRAAAPIAKVIGKVAPPLTIAAGGIEAAQGLANGDMSKVGWGAGDAAAGAALLTPAAPLAGAYLGVRGAYELGQALPDGVRDGIGRTINSGLRGADNILGTHWGTDDSALLAQQAAATQRASAVAQVPLKNGPGNLPAPAVPSDVDAFNKRMIEVGAPSVGMRMGIDGDGTKTRVLGNTAPAGLEAQNAQASTNAARTSLQAGADAANARAEERRSTDAKMAAIADRRFSETGQGAEFAQQMDQARQPRIGAAPVAPPAVIAAQAAEAQKAFEANKGLRMQGVTAMRGQDVTSDDARLTQQTAQLNGMRAQINADRAYGLDVNKQRFDQDKQMVEERTKAETALKDRLSTTMVGADGKPDAQRIGDSVNKINQELAERIKEAQAVPKSNPGYAQAQQIAEQLSKKGLAALDPEDHATLISQLAVRDRVKQAHGVFTPGSSTFVDSRLGDYAVKDFEKNLIGSDTMNLRNGGSVRENDVRFTEPGNPFYNGQKVRTTDFDAGLRKGNK